MSEPGVPGGGPAPVTDRGAPQGARADVVAVLGCYLGLGVVGAVLWWLLAEPAVFTVSQSGTLGMGEVELGQRFSADGWFVVIAAVLGLLAGGALTWWRGRDHLLTAGLVLLGALLATVVMAVLGGILGPPDPATLAGTVSPGQRVPSELEVTARACYLVWPISSLAGALLVLWSPSSDVQI